MAELDDCKLVGGYCTALKIGTVKGIKYNNDFTLSCPGFSMEYSIQNLSPRFQSYNLFVDV